jgi:hypothetical protein
MRRNKRPGKGVSKGVRPKRRKRVWRLAGERCAACRTKVALKDSHCDHIIAVAKSGADDISNLRCLCINCHRFLHGWEGRRHYWRNLKCGCRVRIAYGRRIIPSSRVRRFLRIKWPPRGGFVNLYKKDLCPKHIIIEIKHADGKRSSGTVRFRIREARPSSTI